MRRLPPPAWLLVVLVSFTASACNDVGGKVDAALEADPRARYDRRLFEAVPEFEGEDGVAGLVVSSSCAVGHFVVSGSSRSVRSFAQACR